MKINSKSDTQGRAAAALLWDESFLWSLMAYRALIANGLSFDLIRADDVRMGVLAKYRLLFVPGGWASNKMKALGEAGIEEIRAFVRNGGSYVGFCGGAGLATEDGIGLLPVKRRPTKERVPSFSGPVLLTTLPHPVWQGIADACFHAWWPSQFVVDQGASVLARYGRALPGSFSSDLNVGDTDALGNWAELERVYQINLDPRRLLNEPAVIEGAFGRGTVLLSLIHFDTPNDPNGAVVLRNIWHYLGADGQMKEDPAGSGLMEPASADVQNVLVNPMDGRLSAVETAVSELIDLGSRNFLWYWRNSMLLHWRRGVRGLEYGTLFVMIRELARLTALPNSGLDFSSLGTGLAPVLEFCEKAKQLLVRERFAMQNAHITYERCDDPAIQALREELFSRSKSYGGLFKKAIDKVDRWVYDGLVDLMPGQGNGHKNALAEGKQDFVESSRKHKSANVVKP